MTKLLSLMAATTLALSFGAVHTAASAKTAQQEKMSTCNTQATGKKGDERKAFMKDCLSAQPAAPAKPMTQQEKMTACNKDAAGKKGDERKAFMSECLKK